MEGWHEENKEKVQIYTKQYTKINKNRIAQYRKDNKLKLRATEREKYNNDPLYKLTQLVRHTIRRGFRENNFTKNSKSEQILGCTYLEFKKHIESQFKPW